MTHGPVFHGEFAWIMRAIMSLPVPLSPRIKTAEGLAAQAIVLLRSVAGRDD